MLVCVPVDSSLQLQGETHRLHEEICGYQGVCSSWGHGGLSVCMRRHNECTVHICCVVLTCTVRMLCFNIAAVGALKID